MFRVGLNSFHNDKAVEWAEKKMLQAKVHQFKAISLFHFMWLHSREPDDE